MSDKIVLKQTACKDWVLVKYSSSLLPDKYVLYNKEKPVGMYDDFDFAEKMWIRRGLECAGWSFGYESSEASG